MWERLLITFQILTTFSWKKNFLINSDAIEKFLNASFSFFYVIFSVFLCTSSITYFNFVINFQIIPSQCTNRAIRATSKHYSSIKTFEFHIFQVTSAFSSKCSVNIASFIQIVELIFIKLLTILVCNAIGIIFIKN